MELVIITAIVWFFMSGDRVAAPARSALGSAVRSGAGAGHQAALAEWNADEPYRANRLHDRREWLTAPDRGRGRKWVLDPLHRVWRAALRWGGRLDAVGVPALGNGVMAGLAAGRDGWRDRRDRLVEDRAANGSRVDDATAAARDWWTQLRGRCAWPTGDRSVCGNGTDHRHVFCPEHTTEARRRIDADGGDRGDIYGPGRVVRYWRERRVSDPTAWDNQAAPDAEEPNPVPSVCFTCGADLVGAMCSNPGCAASPLYSPVDGATSAATPSEPGPDAARWTPPSTTTFDYDRQAWVVDGKYVRCGHPDSMNCGCYGRLHEGEPASPQTTPEPTWYGQEAWDAGAASKPGPQKCGHVLRENGRNRYCGADTGGHEHLCPEHNWLARAGARSKESPQTTPAADGEGTDPTERNNVVPLTRTRTTDDSTAAQLDIADLEQLATVLEAHARLLADAIPPMKAAAETSRHLPEALAFHPGPDVMGLLAGAQASAPDPETLTAWMEEVQAVAQKARERVAQMEVIGATGVQGTTAQVGSTGS